MAAIMGRTEVGVREFGRNVTVPASPKAKLMYYLDCICTVMDLSDQRNLAKLRYTVIISCQIFKMGDHGDSEDTVIVITHACKCKTGRDYRNYHLLTETETDALIALALLLSPDELNGKVIFQDDEMCGSNSNTFYELSAVQNNLLLTDSIIIGGQRRAVTKIMAYKRQWFLTNWYNPMLTFAERLAGLAGGHSRHSRAPAVGFRSSNYRYNTFPEPVGTHSNNSDCCCCCTIL